MRGQVGVTVSAEKKEVVRSEERGVRVRKEESKHEEWVTRSGYLGNVFMVSKAIALDKLDVKMIL